MHSQRGHWERGAASGQAAKEIAALAKDTQTGKAMSQPKTGEVDGVSDFLTGQGADARKQANDSISVGEMFGAMSDAKQIEEMRKEKENAQVAFFGGIDATNSGIRKHGGVAGAIKNMVTTAQEAAVDNAVHADDMRHEYGDNLSGASKTSVKAKQKAIAEAQSKVDKARSNIEKMEGLGIGGKQMEAAENQFAAAYDELKEAEGMHGKTLADVDRSIDKSKIETKVGQSVGIDENKAAGVSYSDNAMYGEMSNQQKTKAKLDAQGGVAGAVNIDTMDSAQKAAQQKGAVEGLQSEAEKIGQKIGKEAGKVMEDTAKALSMGKMSADFNSVDRAGSPDEYAAIMGKTARNQMSDKIGTNDEMVAAFNQIRKAENAARALEGKKALPEYDASASTSQAAQGDFDEFVRRTEMNKAAIKNAPAQAMSVLGDAGTALLGGAVINKLAGNPAGRAFGGWKKSRSAKNSVPNKSGNPANNHQNNESANSIKDQHSNSSSNIKNYSEEYGQSKEAFEKESRNLENLQHQRDAAIAKGRDTSVIDNKIEDASKRADMYRENMSTADRNIKAEKYLGSKAPGTVAESGFGKMMRFGGKTLVGADAVLSGYNSYNQFSAGNTTGGMFSAVQSATAAAVLAKPGPVTGAAYTISTAANLGYEAGGYIAKHTGGYTSVVDKFSSSPAPSYAKNAFSTPSGFNTMQAMGGKSAYGDMTDVKNMGSAIHKTDHAQATVDKLQDINIASDYQQEAIEEQNEVSREFMEKFSL
jgi:hypothetical protein